MDKWNNPEMDKWNNKEAKKLITKIVIIVGILIVIFFLFSCNSSTNEVDAVTPNNTPYTTTDSIDVVNNKANTPVSSTGLEEALPVIEVIVPVKEDTTKVIK